MWLYDNLTFCGWWPRFISTQKRAIFTIRPITATTKNLICRCVAMIFKSNSIFAFKTAPISKIFMSARRFFFLPLPRLPRFFHFFFFLEFCVSHTFDDEVSWWCGCVCCTREFLRLIWIKKFGTLRIENSSLFLLILIVSVCSQRSVMWGRLHTGTERPAKKEKERNFFDPYVQFLVLCDHTSKHNVYHAIKTKQKFTNIKTKHKKSKFWNKHISNSNDKQYFFKKLKWILSITKQ